jgi:hypothetical protein
MHEGLTYLEGQLQIKVFMIFFFIYLLRYIGIMTMELATILFYIYI